MLAKHDRAASEFGREYDQAQLAICNRVTATELGRFRQQAGIVLSQYAS